MYMCLNKKHFFILITMKTETIVNKGTFKHISKCFKKTTASFVYLIFENQM